MIRMLDEILLPGFEVEFIVENRPLARRLSEAGVHVIPGDPRRMDTFVKADLGPSTCVIIEDNGRRSPKRIVEAVRDAGGTLIYILGIGAEANSHRAHGIHEEYPDATYLAMATPGVFGPDYFREIGAVLAASRGGPPDRSALAAVMRRHGLTPA